MTDRWLEHLSSELGVSDQIPVEALLDAARVAAHTVERKSAPLTTFLIGMAAAADPLSAESLCRRTIELARTWDAGE
jgi:Domain of unknown function (DUF6457)